MFQAHSIKDFDPSETSEWLEPIQNALGGQGWARAQFLLGRLISGNGPQGCQPGTDGARQ